MSDTAKKILLVFLSIVFIFSAGEKTSDLLTENLDNLSIKNTNPPQ